MLIKAYLGDLHANTLKMLYSLSKAGYITNLDQYYDDLEYAYLENDIIMFIEQLESLNFTSPDCKIILCYIGDILADRCQNDLFTLYLMMKMAENNVPFEIIFSNHDHAFLYNLEKIYNNQYELIEKLMPDEQIHSLINFQQTMLHIKKSSTNPNQSLSLLNIPYSIPTLINNYLAHLKLISLDYDLYGNIVIASHAPLNDQLVCQFFSNAEQSFETSIYQLNQSLLEANYNQFHSLIWNRDTKPNFNLKKAFHLEHIQGEIYHIYGHDGQGKLHYQNAYNLDNLNGKSIQSLINSELPDEILILDFNENIKQIMKENNKAKQEMITAQSNDDYRLLESGSYCLDSNCDNQLNVDQRLHHLFISRGISSTDELIANIDCAVKEELVDAYIAFEKKDPNILHDIARKASTEFFSIKRYDELIAVLIKKPDINAKNLLFYEEQININDTMKEITK